VTVRNSVSARAHTMYTTLCARAKRVMYSTLYMVVRAPVCVHASSGLFLRKPHAGRMLRQNTRPTGAQDNLHLVPHSPAIVPQSKCLTAGLTGVVAQGLKSLVPQCPAIQASYSARRRLRTCAHTHTRAHTRRGTQWEVPRDTAGLTAGADRALSMLKSQENDPANAQAITLPSRADEPLASHVWQQAAHHVCQQPATTACGARTPVTPECHDHASLSNVSGRAGHRGDARRAVRAEDAARRTTLAHVACVHRAWTNRPKIFRAAPRRHASRHVAKPRPPPRDS